MASVMIQLNIKTVIYQGDLATNNTYIVTIVILRVTRSHKRTKDVTRHVTDIARIVTNALAAPDLLGELERPPPDSLAAIGGGILLLRGGKRGEGRGKGRKGRGFEGRGRDCLLVFNFLQRACQSTPVSQKPSQN